MLWRIFILLKNCVTYLLISFLFLYRLFHKNNKNIGLVNLSSHQRSLTQRFIDIYRKLEAKYEGTVSSEQLYSEALEMLKHERQKHGEEPISLTDAFQEAKSERKEQPAININVTDILKD